VVEGDLAKVAVGQGWAKAETEAAPQPQQRQSAGGR